MMPSSEFIVSTLLSSPIVSKSNVDWQVNNARKGDTGQVVHVAKQETAAANSLGIWQRYRSHFIIYAVLSLELWP